MPYRYPRFTREILFQDLSFRGGPSPGQPLPDFELATTARFATTSVTPACTWNGRKHGG